MGVLQQDLEHLRSVRDLDHLVDPHARVQLLNLGFKLRFRVFPHESLDLADKNRLPSEEVRWGDGVRWSLDRERMAPGFSISSISSRD